MTNPLRTICRPQRRGGDEEDRTLDLTDANGLEKLFLVLFDVFYA